MLCSLSIAARLLLGVVTVGARMSTLAFPYLFDSRNALHRISDTGNRRSPRRYNTLRVQAQAARWTGGYEVRAGPGLELVVTTDKRATFHRHRTPHTLQYSVA
jgi:hypothetical protein